MYYLILDVWSRSLEPAVNANTCLYEMGAAASYFLVVELEYFVESCCCLCSSNRKDKLQWKFSEVVIGSNIN